MSISWHNIIEIIATVVITVVSIGGVMFGILKGFFITGSQCIKHQEKCQLNTCNKIDKMDKRLRETRNTLNDHYVEIKSTLSAIEANIENFKK